MYTRVYQCFADKTASLQTCPLEFISVGDGCYLFSTEATSWQDAHWKCQSYNSSLGMITKSTQDAQLRNFLNTNNGYIERWIGGIYDWKQSIWRWGATGKPLKYKGFSRMKPNDSNLQWQCIILDPHLQNKWNSRKCVLKKHFICQSRVHTSTKPVETRGASQNSSYGRAANMEEPAFIAKPRTYTPKTNKKIYACKGRMILLGNKCYTFSRVAVSWNDANWACRESGTRLAVITRKPQNDKLRKFLNLGFVEKQERWLGGIYDWQRKVWKWALSGDIMRYKNFSQNHTISESELRWHCLTMDSQLHNDWSSAVCTERRYYICQTKAHAVIKFGERNKKILKKPNAKVIIQVYKDEDYRKTRYKNKARNVNRKHRMSAIKSNSRTNYHGTPDPA